jgi:hypothetical protein
MFGARFTPAGLHLDPQIAPGLGRLRGIDTMGTKPTIIAACGFAVCISFGLIWRAAAATPCNGVNRDLTSERRTALAAEIAKQLHAISVEVLQSFRLGDWSIIYADTHQSDDVYLFYDHDPAVSHYVTLWSGAAARDEEKSIRTWVLKNTPGIPTSLASCFSWHVTKDRDM